MKLPYNPDAKVCYEGLKKDKLLGPGIDKMTALASAAGSSFEKRLGDVQKWRYELVRQMGDSRMETRVESHFVCAANDVLEGLFSAEAEELKKVPDAADREARVRFLLKALEGIQLDPAWNDYARARIAGRIEKAR